jgi:phosphoribosylaminoimidazole-succinocarboxamide synthase
MLVKKARMLPIECVARGYLAGSGWKEYQAHGTVCGIRLPEGLQESSKLPYPIFTPATKAEIGDHDENIDDERGIALVGNETYQWVKRKTLELYEAGAAYAADRGVIIADTKFEFGWHDGRVILADEILTPDSSRFWPADTYEPGRGQQSYDKQYLRDYLESIGWDKTPPPPPLPAEVIAGTREKYLEAYRQLVGKPFSVGAT